jgi:hypothetical protein
MTICTAAITSEGIVVISDCRVTLNNRFFSDCLLKTVFVTDRCTLAFAGDINCAQWVVEQLRSQHIRDASAKPVYVLLRHIARQLEHAFGEYQAQFHREPYVQFLLAACSPCEMAIGAVDTRKFRLDTLNSIGDALTIGDTVATRSAVTVQVRRAMEAQGFFGFNRAMLLASAVESTIALLYADHYVEGDQRYGISPLFTIFRIDTTEGIAFVPYQTSMFRGRIADRNEPRGYATTNEVEYDSVTRQFFLVDHQRLQRNPLMDLRSWKWRAQGIIGTRFDPYELKG